MKHAAFDRKKGRPRRGRPKVGLEGGRARQCSFRHMVPPQRIGVTTHTPRSARPLWHVLARVSGQKKKPPKTGGFKLVRREEHNDARLCIWSTVARTRVTDRTVA